MGRAWCLQVILGLRFIPGILENPGTVVPGDARADDLLDVEGYTVTTEEAEYLAAFNRGSSFSNPRIRIAYVTRDPKLIWLMRAAAVFSSYSVKDFPTPEAAREWEGEGILTIGSASPLPVGRTGCR